MRVYLGLLAKERGGRIPPSIIEAVHASIGAAFPVPAAQIEGAHWQAPDHDTALFAWSNEPRHELLPASLHTGSRGALGYCGYLADPARGEPALQATGDLGGTAETLGGCFSVFRAGPGRLEAATSIARVCPVYYAETPTLYVAGSRALLVHLVARAARTGSVRPAVDIDVIGLQPMVRHGFFANDETPYRGVRALPAAAVLTVRPGADAVVTETSLPPAEPAPTSAKGVRARVSGLAEALIAAAAPLARHDEPVELALSGGRDSRIMAAVLKGAGVPLLATTHGFADDPDMVLAKEIAGRLGIEHRVDLTDSGGSKESAVTVEHPFLRAYDIIQTCEGMTSAYERVGSWRPYQMTPKTSGSGGETLRGGFIYDQADLSHTGVQKRIKTIFMSGEGFLTGAGNERAREHHRIWAARAEQDRFGVLDQLYLFYRTGRWIVGSHTATLMNSPYYHPFFDNRVVREAMALPAEWRGSEEVVFHLIESLAPELAGIPPEGKRWRFERDRPRRLTEWQAWRRRAAVLPRGRTSGFNWRKSFDEDFLKLLREQVMDAPPELFDVVNEARAKELLAAPPTGWAQQIWHIYTLAVLLSGGWRAARPELPRVRIPIP